jgi:hypothetical protein
MEVRPQFQRKAYKRSQNGSVNVPISYKVGEADKDAFTATDSNFSIAGRPDSKFVLLYFSLSNLEFRLCGKKFL